MAIELRVVQFWSEIILMISNRIRAARSFDFEITRMISDQIALHSVQLPLLINILWYCNVISGELRSSESKLCADVNFFNVTLLTQEERTEEKRLCDGSLTQNYDLEMLDLFNPPTSN